MKNKSTVLSSNCAKKVRAVDDTMYILNGKWKVSLVARLCHKQMRYSELLKDMQGISGKVLSRELKDLEMHGLIKRNVSMDKPITVTYEISEYGMTLKHLTDTIAEWGLQHRERVIMSAV